MSSLARCLVLASILHASIAESQPFSRFWDRVDAGQKRDVASALDQARKLYVASAKPVVTTGHEQLRTRMLDEARGMLRFARSVDPTNQAVLEMIAFVEERRGQSRKALDAYASLYDRRYQRAISGEACTRYGLLLARAGESRRAIEVLGVCINLPRRNDSPHYQKHALINLSNLYAADGRISDAIEVLGHEVENHGVLAEFCLAVLYDKDERISESYEVMERLKNRYRRRLMSMLGRQLSDLPWVPEEDRHYLTAFLLEIQGALPEARDAWLHYIRSGDRARYARRAEQHVRAIDTLLTGQNKQTRSRLR